MRVDREEMREREGERGKERERVEVDMKIAV